MVGTSTLNSYSCRLVIYDLYPITALRSTICMPTCRYCVRVPWVAVPRQTWPGYHKHENTYSYRRRYHNLVKWHRWPLLIYWLQSRLSASMSDSEMHFNLQTSIFHHVSASENTFATMIRLTSARLLSISQIHLSFCVTICLLTSYSPIVRQWAFDRWEPIASRAALFVHASSSRIPID